MVTVQLTGSPVYAGPVKPPARAAAMNAVPLGQNHFAAEADKARGRA